MTALTFSFQPWKFFECNVVDVCGKSAIVLLLVLATAFLANNEEDLLAARSAIKHPLHALFFFPALALLIIYGHWVFDRFFVDKTSSQVRLTVHSRG